MHILVFQLFFDISFRFDHNFPFINTLIGNRSSHIVSHYPNTTKNAVPLFTIHKSINRLGSNTMFNDDMVLLIHSLAFLRGYIVLTFGSKNSFL